MIRLGSTVELEFRQPSPVSATARLAIVSRHRLPLAVDGVLLMAETCIVGGSPPGAHPGPGAGRARSSSTARATPSGAGPPAGFDVDGRTCAARAPLTLQSSVLGDGFSFSLEPLGRQVRSERRRQTAWRAGSRSGNVDGRRGATGHDRENRQDSSPIRQRRLMAQATRRFAEMTRRSRPSDERDGQNETA